MKAQPQVVVSDVGTLEVHRADCHDLTHLRPSQAIVCVPTALTVDPIGVEGLVAWIVGGGLPPRKVALGVAREFVVDWSSAGEAVIRAILRPMPCLPRAR